MNAMSSKAAAAAPIKKSPTSQLQSLNFLWQCKCIFPPRCAQARFAVAATALELSSDHTHGYLWARGCIAATAFAKDSCTHIPEEARALMPAEAF